MFCTACGREIVEGDKFCGTCGRKCHGKHLHDVLIAMQN
ncbi:MAG: zinc-ribbon domain-containing protein [Sedimenticola sp.]